MKRLLTGLCLLISSMAFAQFNNALVVQTPSVDFDSAVKLEYEKLLIHYPNDYGEGGLINGLHRWANFWRSRISYDVPSGTNWLYPYFAGRLNFISNQGLYCNGDPNYYKGNWVCKGPFNNYYGDAFEQQGRVDAVWVDPDSPNHVLAGACAGGLWRTRDTGHTWTNITDHAGSIIQGTIGVSNIAVDPLDEDVIFLSVFNEGAYGKIGDLGSNFGLGVVYTDDGGQNWYKDGDLNPLDKVLKIMFMPGTHHILVMLQNKLLYKDNPGYSGYTDITPAAISSNGLHLTDMELSKTDTGKIVISTNAKDDTSHLFVLGPNLLSNINHVKIKIPNFTQQNTIGGILDFSLNSSDDAVMICRADSNNASRTILIESPTTSVNISVLNRNTRPQELDSTDCLPVYRVEVSPANPDIIYGLLSNGTHSYMKSADHGATFQSYIATAHFRPGNTTRHADGRAFLIYSATNTTDGINDVLYGGTDGGIVMKSAGDSQFHSITGNGLNIMQFYKIATTEANEDYAMGAAQDNGGFSFIEDRQTQWQAELCCDNFGTEFGYGDSTLAISEVMSRPLDAIRFNGNTTTWREHPEPDEFCGGDFDIVSCVNIQRPQYFSPTNQEYIGVYSLLKKGWTDTAYTRPFTPQPKDGIGDTTDFTIRQIADFIISEKDSNIVYIAYRRKADTAGGMAVDSSKNFTGGKLFLSTNAYTTDPIINPLEWENITPPVVKWWHIDDIEIDQDSPNRIWIVLGSIQYQQAEDEYHDPDNTTGRVFYSNNYGAKGSWIDISRGLPPLPVSKIVYLQGSSGSTNGTILFAGTDAGVFRWDQNLNKWTCFNDGMPPCLVTDIDINYCAGKLRIATFGRGMWESSLGSLIQNPLFSNVIATNTTWNTTRYVTGSIEIKPGATLTINNSAGFNPTIHMPKNAYIYVDSGAKLIVSNATITNQCDGCFWGGIRVAGNTSKSQYHLYNYQGQAYFYDATIENAELAIENGNGIKGKTGGVIQAYDTRFLNNRKSVYIHDYLGASNNNFFDDMSRFYDCEFEWDANYKGNEALVEHVALEWVKGVQFKGCSFDNPDGWQAGKGIGIRCTDAGCKVAGGVTNSRSTFGELMHGIWIENTDMYDFGSSILSSDFESCSIGIRLINSEHVTIGLCDFEIGNGRTAFITAEECERNIGIYATNTSFPIIEENDFLGVTVSGQTQNHENWGVLMENCGKTNKQVYRCTFEDLHRGCVAWGANNDYYALTQSQHLGEGDNFKARGLKFICNTYTNNIIDIYADADATHYQGIAMWQGSSCQWSGNLNCISAGNQFGVNSNHHIINHGYQFTYFYDNGTNRTPTSIQTLGPWNYPWQGTVIRAQTNNANSCPTNFGGGIISVAGLKDDFYDLADAKESAYNTYLSLLDGGDTEGLLTYIGSKTISDSDEVHTTLLGHSPFLSNQAIKAAANANILSDEKLIDILEANPEMTRDSLLIEYVANDIPNTLSQAQIDNMLSNIEETTTERSGIESQIANTDAEMTDIVNKLIANMKQDSSDADADSVVVWYDNLNTIEAEYAKAAFYTTRGDYSTASGILTDLPNKFPLSTDEQNEYDGYMDYWELISGVLDDGRTIYEMTSTEINELETLAASVNEHTITYGAASTVINIHAGTRIPCGTGAIACCKTTTSGSKNQHPISQQHFRSSKAPNVTAYPNPANSIVNFEYWLPGNSGNTVLIVRNIVGQEVNRVSITDKVGISKWETNNMPAGVYMYSVRDGKNVIKTGRVVISR